jgi:hypothetical protein
MAWERNFEKRVLKIREKELEYQRLNYTIEVCFAIVLGVLLSKSCVDPLECHLVVTLYNHMPFNY